MGENKPTILFKGNNKIQSRNEEATYSGEIMQNER
jgi:hypothetical protein